MKRRGMDKEASPSRVVEKAVMEGGVVYICMKRDKLNKKTKGYHKAALGFVCILIKTSIGLRPRLVLILEVLKVID